MTENARNRRARSLWIAYGLVAVTANLVATVGQIQGWWG